MAQDLKISAVVKRDPWSNDYGKYQTYAVQFEQTGDKWIQWNKKFKGDEEPTPPQTGDEVFGDIDAKGKFKIGKKDGGFTPSASTTSFKGSTKSEWKDNSCSIEAQSAVKSAAQVFAGTGADFADVEKMARQLHNLIAVLANGDTPKSELPKGSGYEAFKAAGGQVKEDLPPADSYEDIIESGEPIDMSKIPF